MAKKRTIKIRPAESWLQFKTISDHIGAIERDAQIIHEQSAKKVDERHHTDLWISNFHLRRTYDDIAALLDSEGKKNLQRLFGMAYRAGSLGLGTDMAFVHPLGPKSRTQSKSGSSGGKNSGEARLRIAADKWQIEGLEIAKEYLDANPKASQDKIAEEIRFKLDDKAPGHSQVKKVVAVWLKDPNKLVRPV